MTQDHLYLEYIHVLVFGLGVSIWEIWGFFFSPDPGSYLCLCLEALPLLPSGDQALTWATCFAVVLELLQI